MLMLNGHEISFDLKSFEKIEGIENPVNCEIGEFCANKLKFLQKKLQEYC